MTPSLPTRRRHAAPVLTIVLLVGLLAVLAAALWAGLAASPPLPLHLTVDGETVLSGWDFHALDGAAQLGLVGALVLGLLAVMATLLVVVPLAVMLALGAAALGVALGLGLPLLVVGGVAAVVLSPLILLGWLVWRLLRPSPTIAA